MIGILFVSACAQKPIAENTSAQKTYINSKFGYQVSFADSFVIEAVGMTTDPTDAPEVHIRSVLPGYSGISIEAISPYYTKKHKDLFEFAKWIWETNDQSKGNCKQDISPLMETSIGARNAHAYRFDLKGCFSIGSAGRVLDDIKTVTIFETNNATFISLYNPTEAASSLAILNTFRSLE